MCTKPPGPAVAVMMAPNVWASSSGMSSLGYDSAWTSSTISAGLVTNCTVPSTARSRQETGGVGEPLWYPRSAEIKTLVSNTARGTGSATWLLSRPANGFVGQCFDVRFARVDGW